MRTLQTAAATAAIYLLLARYSVLLHDLSGLGVVFWAGAGVTVTALVVSDRRSWPAIVVAVGLTEFANDLALGFEVLPSAVWSVANVVGPVIAAWLITHWKAERLADVRQVMVLVFGAAIGPIIGGTIGAMGTSSDVTSLPYAVTAIQWGIGDGLGILTVVPVGLLVGGRISHVRLMTPETGLMVATMTLASIAVFAFAGPGRWYLPDYLVLLPMVWAAVRQRVAGTALTVFIAAQIGNAAYAFGRGPFFGPEMSAPATSAQLQFFLGAISVTALLLGSRTLESANFHDLANARQQLINAVSHELRTPLTPIIGFSELILRRRDGLDGQTRQAVEVIERNARHLTALIDDLLEASRARRGRIATQPGPVEVQAFLADLLTSRGAEGEINVDCDPPGLRVRVDRTHLTQIVTNLLDNAERYGRPPVGLGVTAEGPMVRVTVKDAGNGVPAWFVPRLFEEFAQAAEGDQPTRIGLGLGLPIARALALANGGDLAYERSPGPGATFVLTLPVAGPLEGGRLD